MRLGHYRPTGKKGERELEYRTAEFPKFDTKQIQISKNSQIKNVGQT